MPNRFFLGGKRNSAQDEFFEATLRREGWKPTEKKNWQSCWFTGMPPARFFDHLRPGQSINHLPGNNALTVKDYLARTVSRWHKAREHHGQRTDQEHWHCIPPVYSMPEDREAFLRDAREHPDKKWILKPKNASKGKDISLVSNPESVPLDKRWMVQTYLDRPHLYQKHKYVLRLYALIASVDPLRLYLFEEGSVKLTSNPYDPDDLSNLFAHLTNPDINEANSDSENPVVFLSLSEYRDWLAGEGFDATALFDKIKEQIRILAIAAQPHFRHSLRKIKGSPFGCYELLGIDCLIDDSLRPWILEANLSPSLDICSGEGMGREAELSTKKALAEDAIRLLQLTRPEAKRFTPSLTKDVLSGILEAEERHRGRYERLLPDPELGLSLFPYPRHTDVLACEALTGKTYHPPPLEPDRVEETVENDKLFLTDRHSGKKYTLNQTGTAIWLHLTDGTPPHALARQWTQDTPPNSPDLEQWESLIWQTLTDWLDNQFLKIASDQPSSSPENEPRSENDPPPAHSSLDRYPASQYPGCRPKKFAPPVR